jgi:hypothetical protein
MSVKQNVYLIPSLACILLGMADCSPVMPVTEQTSQTAPAEQTGPFHPLSARTGNENIDPVLEAVASGDRQALISLVQLTEAVCTHADGLGGPPKCRDGEAEGTAMDVLPFLGGEGSYLRSEEIGDWQGIDVSALYAVYEVSPENVVQEEYFPSGEYVIVLIGGENQSPVALRVTDGRIVRVDFLFEPTPEALNPLLEREAARVILPPKNP